MGCRRLLILSSLPSGPIWEKSYRYPLSQKTAQVYLSSERKTRGGDERTAWKETRNLHKQAFQSQNLRFSWWVSKPTGDQWPQPAHPTAAGVTDCQRGCRGGPGQRAVVPGWPVHTKLASREDPPASALARSAGEIGGSQTEAPITIGRPPLA